MTRAALDGRPAGSVGTVVHAPADLGHAYRVRFSDGAELALPRSAFGVRRQEKNRLPDGERDFTPFVQYRCVAGSRAFGLATDASDTDLRGFYLPPVRDDWSLGGVSEQLEFGADGTEEVYWETRKFVLLALEANPNILEVLHSPQVITATLMALEVLELRGAFLSRLVYQTYAGYVAGQFSRIEADLRVRGQVRWKHAMHLLRVLMSGTHLLHTDGMLVDVGPHRDRLLAIRRGEVAWADVEAWRLELHRAFEATYTGTILPERPDYARVQDWLIRARRAALEW
ncbi:DNA polymerase beta superfamily protein [Deinococcus sp.]|uniref:nucleotidyltransferase domain-containing protein n=1 Tax=Deinococcus sp. TaxID=47478 RepID=UPI002869A312|nr:nucleotidyltransferase domain-containing protein [Deinococcus sp.]